MEQMNETTYDLRRYQLDLLEILDAFTAICRDKGLRYYLNAGTLLGAVRHGGFIPWDDDIDVCMPRGDYECFLSCAPAMLPPHLRAVWFGAQTRDEHPQYYCQIQNLRLPITQYVADIPRETFAWIDVFPLDGMPGGRLHRKLHGLELLYRRARVQLSMFEQNVNVHKRGRPWHERAVIALYRATGIGKGSDTFRMMEKLDRALRRCPADESPVWVNFMGAYKLKESFPADAYGAGVPCVFEGRELMIPRQSARILTQLYGDYMIPRMPSEEDSHRIVRRADAGN